LPPCLLLAQAQEGVVAYQKTQQPAALIHLPYSQDVVNDAMDDYLSKRGTRTDQLKGFKSFRNTRIPGKDTVYADLYFKVNRMSRDEKEKTTVYLLVGMPNDAIALRNASTSITVEEAKEVLNQLAPAIEAFNLERMIKEQNAVVIKEEGRYKSLVKEGGDLSERRSDIEKKIIANQQDQEKQNSEVNRQKQVLAQLADQRKTQYK
ncbi:MAG TPA: hypothetical protein VGE66_07790, partial [Chitinophagaceae bacterium]